MTRTPTMTRRPRGLLALSIALAVAAAGAAHAGEARLGPNLAPNPSFETSLSDVATANGVPVLPTGWTFEGSTVLFDYNQRAAHSGLREVSISGALGGGTQVCDQSSGGQVCVSNPAYAGTHAADSATVGSYSVRPVWRPTNAVPVTAGSRYRFAVWALRPSLDPNGGVLGEGASTRVRWVDSAGKVVSVVQGASLVKTARRVLGFLQISADLTAPAGATGAVLLLGHTDYSHTGAQVSFDDVSFQRLL